MPNSTDKKLKKERITFYAPPKVFTVLENILSDGTYTNQGDAICAAIIEYGKSLKNDDMAEKMDGRFSDLASEIETLNATINILQARVDVAEQKYALVIRAVAEYEKEYIRKKS